MSETIQIPGRFRYQANAIPKGNRNVRRILVHAPILYEIETVDGSEVRRDAVRIRTHAGEEIAYAMHAGRLWRPANPDNPISLEDYRRMAQSWPAMADRLPDRGFPEDDPIAHSHDFCDDIQWPSRGGLALYNEEEFEGQLFLSDRDTTHGRYLNAARYVLLIDGEIYFAAPEPVWEASYDGAVQLLAPQTWISHHHFFIPSEGHRSLAGWRLFAADRCEDAVAFATQIYPDSLHPIEGEVFTLAPDYAPPPTMSRTVQGSLYNLFRYDDLYPGLVRHLSPTSFTALGALQAAAASLTTHSLGQLDRDPSALIEGLRSIVTDLDGKLIAEDRQRDRERLLESLRPVLQRADFEAARKPRLTEEDDVLIASAALSLTSACPRP